LNTKPVTHVVYGQDKMAKPRAAVIPAMDLDTAHRAAASLGLKIGRADTPEAIKAGSLTLCKDPEPGPDRSWWECVVQSVTKDGKLLKVRWKNYPGQPAFTVRRDAVAILPPSAAAKS
jgi:hypothetical protein